MKDIYKYDTNAKGFKAAAIFLLLLALLMIGIGGYFLWDFFATSGM